MLATVRDSTPDPPILPRLLRRQAGRMAALAGECSKELGQWSVLGLSSLLCPAEGKKMGPDGL